MREKVMALKFKYKSKDEVPVEHLPFYAEREGVWQLDADGVADKTKLDEFRNNNTALLKQLEEQKKRFDGIDPDEFRKLTDEAPARGSPTTESGRSREGDREPGQRSESRLGQAGGGSYVRARDADQLPSPPTINFHILSRPPVSYTHLRA